MTEQAPATQTKGTWDIFNQLLRLCRMARSASTLEELGFMAVNDSHSLSPYRQAALWRSNGGVYALSGVVQIEANAPYVHWLNRICQHWWQQGTQHQYVGMASLPPELAQEWAQWLPEHGLWISLADPQQQASGSKSGTNAQEESKADSAGLLLVRDAPWEPQEVALLAEWLHAWAHAWHTLEKAQGKPQWQTRFRGWWQSLARDPSMQWWKQRRYQWLAGLMLLLLCPVRLTVLAPAELVAAKPALVRAPLDGVISDFFVQPNVSVKAGQLLFQFDQASLQSKMAVAQQALMAADAELRQSQQLAMNDAKSKGQLAALAAQVQERQAEADYVSGQLERAKVLAPTAGIVLLDDPSEWTGRPVNTGEKILRIAQPHDIEIEAWLDIGDAIVLVPGDNVRLYLSASPWQSVDAAITYVTHDAVKRPDGHFAYRVRAALNESTDHRIGLKGTAKLTGRWVPLVYWALRRPMASIRQTIGW